MSSENLAALDSHQGTSGYIRAIENGTLVAIVLETELNSENSRDGDVFFARTIKDLTMDDFIVVPRGALIKGKVTSFPNPEGSEPTPMLQLQFDSVAISASRELSLVARLVSKRGLIHVSRNEFVRGKRVIRDIVVHNGTTQPYQPLISDCGGARRSRKPVRETAFNVPLGTSVLLAAKGKKIELRKNDELKIELLQSLHYVQ